MPVTIEHNKATKAVKVTVEFQADTQVEKAGLARNVIENHLLGQAARCCQECAADVLKTNSEAALIAEAAAKKKQIDDELAAARAARFVTSNVAANPK